MAFGRGTLTAKQRLAKGRGFAALGYDVESDSYQQPVNSTAIRVVGYDPAAQQLHITFLRSGRTYTYYGVPSSVHRALVNASSIGRYFNFNVRNRYQYSG